VQLVLGGLAVIAARPHAGILGARLPIVEVFVQLLVRKRPAEVSILRLDEAIEGYGHWRK
jgi:hypothetical protein